MKSSLWQIGNGWTFALWPLRCIDGRVAWLRKVYWADVNEGIFYSPYTVTRYYSLDAGPYTTPHPTETEERA